MTRAVVLFTRDLRVHDQAALSAAVEASAEVVPLFVLDDALRRSAARDCFLRQALADLRSSLRGFGGDLFVRRAEYPERYPIDAMRAAML